MSFQVSDIAALSERIDWDKVDGLLPVIVQDFQSSQVLMMGYMNQDALAKTGETGHVTFYSRTKQRLWTKGETSGNVLNLVNAALDCDNDTLLVKVNPIGPTCHTVLQPVGMAISKKSRNWFGFINLNSSWLLVKMPIPNHPTPLVSMPVAPNVFRRKWAKRALKSRLRQRRVTRRN
ncbi:phosphoribosyl-AMP cyclohydrolase [Vibrio ponticus]|nr:phosphoribosyl-AMP cyclohydrolase [Vibrio ponticus]